jgi:hypothetical protein
MASRRRVRVPRSYAEYEYVTSAVSMLEGDGVVVHVVNDSSTTRSSQIIIYRNTGAGAVTAADSNSVGVAPTWNWGLAFTISESGEYWLRIRASSAVLIPKASFERIDGSVWVPFVTYRPGDFAVFKLRPARKRLW